MADYNINAITRRVVFTGSAGLGPYAFSFEILDENDVAVYFNTTSLTLTTDFTVTINANGTGSVNIVTGSSVPSTPTASDTIIIIGARDIERVTDFVTAGDLLASSLNEQLDALTIFDQQLAEEGQRSMRAPVFDPALVADGGTLDMTLPSASERAGKNLAFDANGNPEAGEDIGTFRGNWAASTTYYKRDIVKDGSNGNIYRVNTEHTSSGSTPISSNADAAKFDLVVDNEAAAANAQLAEDWAKETTSDVNSTGEYSSKAYAIGGTGVTNTSGKGAAKEWATTTGSTVDTSEYSAKEYAIGTTVAAGSAKDWASQASGTVDGSEYSAKYYSGLASTSASNAATSESNAATSETNASNAQTAAEAALDAFDDTYLGAKTSAPTVDNDGDPLAVGMLYTNSSSGNLFYYNGSAWVAVTSGGITDIVDDATPQLGGDLDVQTNSIVSTSNQDINITPDGTGNVTLGSFTFDADQTVGAGQDNYVLTYDNTGGLISLEPAAGGGLADVVDDLTPQLGGDLQSNGNDIVFADNDKAIFGAGSDLQIYHDGVHSTIKDAGSGNLFLQSSNNIYIQNASGSANYFKGTDGGASELFHNGSTKLATSATGVSVTGTVAATAFTGDGSGLTGVSGGLVQTVSTHHVTSTTISGTAFTQYSGLNTAITPTSSSNKVLVTVHISFSGVADSFPAFRIYRGGTWIAQSATVSPGIETTFAHAIPTGGASPTTQMGVASFTFLDSPSTTSATTYSVYISPMRTTSRTLRINESYSRGDDNQYSAGSTMTLMEVT